MKRAPWLLALPALLLAATALALAEGLPEKPPACAEIAEIVEIEEAPPVLELEPEPVEILTPETAPSAMSEDEEEPPPVLELEPEPVEILTPETAGMTPDIPIDDPEANADWDLLGDVDAVVVAEEHSYTITVPTQVVIDPETLSGNLKVNWTLTGSISELHLQITSENKWYLVDAETNKKLNYHIDSFPSTEYWTLRPNETSRDRKLEVSRDETSDNLSINGNFTDTLTFKVIDVFTSTDDPEDPEYPDTEGGEEGEAAA